MKELPLFKRLGALSDVQIDARDRRVRIDAYAKLQRSDDWYRLVGVFTGVVYVRTLSDRQTFFLNDENGLHGFVEFKESTLLRSVQTSPRGLVSIVTDIGSMSLASSGTQPPKLRHFVVQSSSVCLEWLCEGVDVQVERDPSLNE